MNLGDLTNGKYYLYQVNGGGAGIVKADDEIKAKLRVAFAYHRHDHSLDIHTWDVDVQKIEPDNHYFADAPNVIELAWSIQVNR